MAKADWIPAPREMILRLTEEEAEVLKYVLGRTSGSRTGNKYAISAIYNTLRDMGVGDPEGVSATGSLYIE